MEDFDPSYKPTLLFKSGHINTIYPYFFRSIPQITFQRERIALPDGDFLDLDWSRSKQKKLAVLCHGLEGSSNSKYILHLTKHLTRHDIDVLAINYRSCSGDINLNPRVYHSGATDDLHYVITSQTKEYSEVYLMLVIIMTANFLRGILYVTI